MWLALVLIFFGLAIAIIGISVLWTVGRQRRDWVKRTGRVVAVEPSLTARVRFEVAYQDVDGREVTFWNPFPVMTGRRLVGRTVDVLANPADPDDAVVEKGAARPTVTGAMFLAAGGFLSIGGVAMLIAS